MKKVVLIVILVGAMAALLALAASRRGAPVPGTEVTGTAEYRFKSDGLNTNTARASVPLDRIISGGPARDGIPAIDAPQFTSIEAAETFLTDRSVGIAIEVDGSVRFYPFAILNWHEIVNDVVNGRALAITYCPLCRSAIVFDAGTAHARETFGVSGKLYENNLLMYDRRTESLWSQSRGEAVVGDRLGETLSLYPFQQLAFGDLQRLFPGAQVLSTETGHYRDYGFNPYLDYDEREDLIFPVSFRDDRLPTKELMYVVPVAGKSAAFPFTALREAGSASLVVGPDDTLTVTVKEGLVRAVSVKEGELPGYYEVWFSWVVHHQEDGILWTP